MVEEYRATTDLLYPCNQVAGYEDILLADTI
jgi:hypothetical protein